MIETRYLLMIETIANTTEWLLSELLISAHAKVFIFSLTYFKTLLLKQL